MRAGRSVGLSSHFFPSPFFSAAEGVFFRSWLPDTFRHFCCAIPPHAFDSSSPLARQFVGDGAVRLFSSVQQQAFYRGRWTTFSEFPPFILRPLIVAFPHLCSLKRRLLGPTATAAALLLSKKETAHPQSEPLLASFLLTASELLPDSARAERPLLPGRDDAGQINRPLPVPLPLPLVHRLSAVR